MRVNSLALGTGGVASEERGSAASGDCIIRVNSPGAVVCGDGAGDGDMTGLSDWPAEDVRGGTGAAGVWANTRVNSPSSGWAGAPASISAGWGCGVAAVDMEGGCSTAECRMLVNSPGVGTAGARAWVAVAVGFAGDGGAAERRIRVNSPGSAGAAGTFGSSLGIGIEAVGNSSGVGGGRRTCSSSFTASKSRVNSPGSKAGVSGAGALFGGASLTAGILQTPLRAGLAVVVEEARRTLPQL